MNQGKENSILKIFNIYKCIIINSFLLSFSILFLNVSAVSAGESLLLLTQVAENITTYQNKTITMNLRLRNVDNVFDKIVFYDKKNIDIVFDISEFKKSDIYKRASHNLHEGMVYNVTFIVRGLGNLGELSGELVDFKVDILDQLPDDKKDPSKARKAE